MRCGCGASASRRRRSSSPPSERGGGGETPRRPAGRSSPSPRLGWAVLCLCCRAGRAPTTGQRGVHGLARLAARLAAVSRAFALLAVGAGAYEVDWVVSWLSSSRNTVGLRDATHCAVARTR
jgi:hypothetical protein